MVSQTKRDRGRAVYVTDGSRTPFLKAKGRPGPFSAADLAVAAGRPLLLRQPFEAQALDEVILGCVMPAPEEANIARVVSLRLGCGERVPAWTVQRNCGSGLQAVDSAARDIVAGRADLVLAGGVEAMSRAPLLLSPGLTRWLADWRTARGVGARVRLLVRLRPAQLAPVAALRRGLSDPVVGLSMGQTAENLAHRFRIRREEADAYALRSHRRLAEAQDRGWLNEIEPLWDESGRLHERDDGVRRDTDLHRLAALRPAFDGELGQVTAGNSAQITDGAAWLLLASEAAVERHGLSVLGRLVDSEWAALDPAQMGLGPVLAATPLLRRSELRLGDIDAWEINEAFAAQVLACLAAWGDEDFCREVLGESAPWGSIDPSRLNVDGGAIGLGHPIGASGARIVLHLLHVMERLAVRRGVAALCIGGGQGGATLVEREAG
jgi:acetyl-CoA C-acetyltransferase